MEDTMSPHAVTAIATPQAAQCVQVVAGPEPFSMIDQQAGLVVKLATGAASFTVM